MTTNSQKNLLQPLSHGICIPFVFALCISTSTRIYADVFRYVDEKGVVCFTDCPTKKGAVRIMRERKKPSGERSKTALYSLGKRVTAAKPKTNVWESNLLEGLTLPVSGRISSPVGLRHDPIDGLLRYHNGIDIAVPEGTPVRPVAPGTVYFSGTRNGYGNMVIINHDDGMITIYAHHSLNLVKEGERVGRETTIALSGSTGRTTGPHLHFEAWKNGENLTEAFLGRMPANSASLAAVHPRREIIRTSIMADGSILFTNLP